MTMTRELPVRLGTMSDVVRPMLPILIQVPALTPSKRGVVRTRPRRRRLRKEVRFAGLTMMSVIPVGFLLMTLGGAKPVDLPAKSAAAFRSTRLGRDSAPRVSLTFEPTGQPSASRTSAPVVFPGYLLPVDGPEESVHAGN